MLHDVAIDKMNRITTRTAMIAAVLLLEDVGVVGVAKVREDGVPNCSLLIVTCKVEDSGATKAVSCPDAVEVDTAQGRKVVYTQYFNTLV